YEMARMMGHWAARTRFCEVFVNDSGGRLQRRHYVGVYVFEEKVKRAEHRVHIAALKPEHDREPEITGGYIFKKDHFDQGVMMEDNLLGTPPFRGSSSRSFFSGPGGFPADPAGFLPERGAPEQGRGRREGVRGGGGLESMVRELLLRSSGGPVQPGDSPGMPETFSTRSGQTFFFVEPEPDEITPAQRRWLVEYLNRLEDALNGADFRDPDRGYRAFLDVDSFIDQHLMVEVTKNIDGFRFSAFYHKDRGGKVRMQPVWDWNLSFGNANGKQGWLSKYWYWPQLDDRQYTWFRRLFEDPDFAQRYVDRYFELRTNVFSPARLEARIDELASLLEEAQVRNFRRWPILDQKVWPNYFVFDTYAEEIRFLKSWTRDRISWIDAQFVAPPTVASRDGGRVTLQAGAGSIYYVLDGSDPRAPGGGVAKAARVCEGAILAPKGTRLVARVKVGDRWSAPLAMTL
ncbi:MAG TPA: CotH kinase family protein, partial [Methylomirabilota bacterium]|nr:CotH kinase family protein [Methylomirabilota bacterium]